MDIDLYKVEEFSIQPKLSSDKNERIVEISVKTIKGVSTIRLYIEQLENFEIKWKTKKKF